MGELCVCVFWYISVILRIWPWFGQHDPVPFPRPQDERGMGFVNDCESGEDVANLSGGENNENRELNRRKRRRVSKPKPAKADGPRQMPRRSDAVG